MSVTAQARVAAGWRTHVLWCCGADNAGLRACQRAACTTWRLDDLHCPPSLTLTGPGLFEALHDSDRVAHALRKLHALHRFDAIEFSLQGGLGFRTVQAKQTGQCFTDVALIVHDGATAAARCHEASLWPDRPEVLTLDSMERYTLRYADGMECAQASDTSARTSAAHSQSLVTICVPYFNLGEHLEETLASLAAQSYPHLEVIVINDGYTDAQAIDVFGRMQAKFGQFRFHQQANAGIGATRNRGLAMAKGEYFLPVDADNIADPDMVRRFVQGMDHNRDIDALTCYFLAFRNFADLIERRFLYAYKPVGGPRVLGCWQNIYGDGNAMFRTETLRAVGGFEQDRATSFEDWEAFVKLVDAGRRVEVLPDFLFYYRHRDGGFSRVTSAYRNRQRVLRRFMEIDTLAEHERRLLWNWLVGSQERLAALELENQRLRRKLASPARLLARGLKQAMKNAMKTTKFLAGY